MIDIDTQTKRVVIEEITYIIEGVDLLEDCPVDREFTEKVYYLLGPGDACFSLYLWKDGKYTLFRNSKHHPTSMGVWK